MIVAVSDDVTVALIGAIAVIGVALIQQLRGLRKTNTEQHGRAVSKLEEFKAGFDRGMREMRGEVRELVGQVGELRGEAKVRHSDHVAQIDQLDEDVRTLTEDDKQRHSENVERLDKIDGRVTRVERRVDALAPPGGTE